MSRRHPIVAVTGLPGGGTKAVRKAFEDIFQREGLDAAMVEGDGFHRFGRAEIRARAKQEAGDGHGHFSTFGPDANLFGILEALFRDHGASGNGCSRRNLHDATLAAKNGQEPGTFTLWRRLPDDADLHFYEGPHGGLVTPEVHVARHVDLLVGVPPTVDLGWIAAPSRFFQSGNPRWVPDYVAYIRPQFSLGHVNVGWVPVTDTSNPSVGRAIAGTDESLIAFPPSNPARVDFRGLLSTLDDAIPSRPDTIACPGGRTSRALDVDFTPMIRGLMAARVRD